MDPGRGVSSDGVCSGFPVLHHGLRVFNGLNKPTCESWFRRYSLRLDISDKEVLNFASHVLSLVNMPSYGSHRVTES